MSQTYVINYTKVGYCVADGNVYIGRDMPHFGLKGGKFQNTFRADEWGHSTAIEKYEKWLWKSLKKGRIHPDEVLDLKGKGLVCFCKPKACHGDILVKAINWLSVEENYEKAINWYNKHN